MCAMNNCLPLPLSATRKQIEEYDRKVRNNQIPCIFLCCIQCQATADKFYRHETRVRTFWIIEDQLIIVVLCMVIRWKCKECKKTITAQPDFALPRKRYTLPTILSLCEEYVTEDGLTYRDVVIRHPFGHEGSDAMLSHTTVFRWTDTLGGYPEISRTALDLILQKKPASSICRDIFGLQIAPRKYRSSERKQTLIDCICFLGIEFEFRGVFKKSIFPIHATRTGFT
jgi:hypothetical protein